MLPVLLALASASLFAVAATLQQLAASSTVSARAVDPGLLLRLVRRPMWLAGFGAVLMHFSLQAAALGTGRLLLVEPVLATGLLFALPLSAWVTRRRMQRGDWVAAAATTGGLATFVALAAPGGGHRQVGVGALAPVVVCAVAVCVVVGLVAARLAPRSRSVLLGAAAGIGAASTDATTKTVVAVAATTGSDLLGDPRLLLLALIGLTTFTVQQNAYRTSGLAACLPVLYVVQPVTGSLLGVLVYHEHAHGGVVRLTGELLAAAVAALGIVRLARSSIAELGAGGHRVPTVPRPGRRGAPARARADA